MSQTPCAAIQTIIDQHDLTLLIVGHTHEYHHDPRNREIIVGNGGAPLTSGVNYGYVIVARAERQPDDHRVRLPDARGARHVRDHGQRCRCVSAAGPASRSLSSPR